MSARKYLSYTYLIGWSKQDLWYYGVRWTQKRKTEFDIGIHYFTSSKYVKQARNLYGEPDVIHIDKTFTCEKEAQKYEKKVLKEHKVLNKKYWLNKNIGGIIFWDSEMKEQKSIKMTGKNNPMYGRKHTKEARKKQGFHKHWLGKKHTNETKEKQRKSQYGKNNSFYGRKHTDETKEKQRLKQLGKKQSQETIRKRILKNNKKIEIFNKIYNSQKEASIDLDISESTISTWLKNGKAKRII